MPEISRFFGIIIRMYMEAGAPHHRPHFHAYYQDDVAVFSLSPIELIAGSLPRRQQRFVEAWAELHETELLADWERLQSVQSPFPIEPLDYDGSMTHALYRVRSFAIEGPYTLRVRFDDATEQVIDFLPVLAGEMFGPLRDLTVFNAVRLDEEVHTLVWPNGADFDPATLHDWAKYVNELANRAIRFSHI